MFTTTSNEPSTLKLWHGGRHLEAFYREYRGSQKGRWEHGPGLYLTTHYETAARYARGGGKTYMVEIREGTRLGDVMLSLEIVEEFIQEYVIHKKRLPLRMDILRSSNRMGVEGHIAANRFMNLVINLEAIPSSRTGVLNSFLVNNGVDYEIVDSYGGRDETVFVIFNNKIIRSVKPILSADVNVEDHVLSPTGTGVVVRGKYL